MTEAHKLTELVTRLTECAGNTMLKVDQSAMREAAGAISRLTAELAEVRAALKPSKTLSDEIDNMLDEHDVEGALRDSLAYDIGLLMLPLAHAAKDLAASGNYVANDDTFPTEITFANGRVVRLSEDHSRLIVSTAALLENTNDS